MNPDISETAFLLSARFVGMLSSSALECILKTMWFWCRDSLVSSGGMADSFK